MAPALPTLVLLLASSLTVLCAAASPPSPPPNVTKLEQQYSKLLNSTCAQVVPHIPTLPASDVAAFMDAYRAFNGSNSEAAVIHLAGELLAPAPVQSYLSLPWTGGALDTAMVKCAVLFDATPLGLAQFAVLGSAQESIVSDLLGNALLMRDMLLGGGAAGGNYGQATSILQSIYNASTVLPHTPTAPSSPIWDDRNQTTMLHRLALGTALAHAVPIKHRYVDPVHPNDTYVDPVKRYLHYEQHYLAGDLDPAIEVLTAFECSWTTNCDATDEDLEWLRTTMENFRPEAIAMDYTWRYAESVHTDVAYGDPACAQMPGICDGHYAQIPAAGGECGPRAFWGRYSRKSFGLPTFGVTQPGHAAMTTWAPDGWHVLLGAAWEYSWWHSRGGPSFFLETQVREMRPQYQKVLRGSWAADALGEAPVNPAWTPRSPNTYGQGGVWNALMLYAQKLAVNTTAPPPPRPIGPSVVPTKVQALIDKWPANWPAPNVTTDSAGNIVIPGAALSSKNRTAPVSVMKSFFEGEQLLVSNGNFADPAATSFSYVVTVDAACTRYLTVNHTTWHMNTDLLLTTNTTTKGAVNVPVYYTVGWWNQTQPIEVSLVKGTNVLTFSRSTPAAIAIKEFFLYVNKPDIPPPPKNHTTKPVPRPSDYIEVPPTTTCVKQGITSVPEQDCQMACEALGLDYTGAKPRTNMTGCFALTDGQWKGNCNFNSNKTATICPQQPCTIFGSTVAQLCIRK